MNKPLLFPLLFLALSAQAQSPYRLIKEIGYNFSLPADTILYKYSGGRGSYLGYNLEDGQPQGAHKYDSAFTAEVKSPGVIYHTGDFQAFNSDNNIAEKTSAYYDEVCKCWQFIRKEVLHYGAGNRVDISTTTSNAGATFQTAYTYTPSGNFATIKRYQGAATGTPLYTDSFAYDASGKIAYYSQYDNTMQQLLREAIYTYNASGQLVQRDEQVYQTNSLVPGKTEFSYTGNETTELVYSYSNAQQQLVLTQRITNTFGIHNNIVKSIVENHYNGTYTPAQKLEYTYNAYGQRTHYGLKRWISNAWEANEREVRDYYYEQYTTGVNDAAQQATGMRLYPNPSADILYVSGTWQEAQAFTVTITDMQGKAVRTLSEPQAKGYTRVIPLQGMPAGNYILQLHGAKESAVRQFTIQ